MKDCVDTLNISNKAKDYLNTKLDESLHIIRKKKLKMKIVKGLYYSTTISSIILSALTASIGIGLPIVVVTILPTLSAILTGLGIHFNFKDRQHKITKEVERCKLIQSKLEYIVQSNGDLTDEIYKQIVAELAQF